MQKLLILSALILLTAGSVTARTWTSKDGESTFEGRFYGYDKGVVTVILPDGRSLKFEDSSLSEVDLEWLKENGSRPAAASAVSGKAVEHVIAGDIGSRLKVLNGQRFAKYEPKPTAEYYILLFSASWCPPCRAAAPGYVKMYNDQIAAMPNVEMVLVSRDNDERAALAWAVAEKMPWAVLSPSDYGRATEVQKHAPRGIPYAVLVDAKGKGVANGSLAACLNAVKQAK